VKRKKLREEERDIKKGKKKGGVEGALCNKSKGLFLNGFFPPSFTQQTLGFGLCLGSTPKGILCKNHKNVERLKNAPTITIPTHYN
jgi:hypothetical protein